MTSFNSFYLFLFICIFCTKPIQSQNSRFNVGLVAGLNFSELEGDGITSYYGLNTGILGTARLSKHSQLGMELLFSQNGEYVLPKYYPQLQYGQVWLNHLEIPIHIDWLIGVFQRKKFYDWNLNVGIAYTRLTGYSAKTLDGIDITNQLIYKSEEAYLLQAGTTYHFTKKVALNFKASLPIRIDGLSWTLGARVIYIV